MRRNVHDDLVLKYDLTAAREYGELQILLPSGPVMVDNIHAVTHLRDKLQDFNALDKLLCLGDPVIMAACAAIVADVNDGVIPLLVWDRQIKKYMAITVDINE